MISLILTLVISNAFASYDGDIKKINAMGDRADSILSKYGFTFDGKEKKTNGEEKVHSLFVVQGDLANEKLGTGSLAFGNLLTRLVVGSEESPVLVTIQDSNNSWLQGLRLLGKARQSATVGRVDIDFDHLLLRNGKAVALQATALDEAGALGLEASIFSGKALSIAGSMAGSFISGYASGQQTTTTNAFGFSSNQPSGRNAILQGVAQSTADQSKRLIEEATAEKPVLVIEAGTKVSILVKEEMHL